MEKLTEEKEKPSMVLEKIYNIFILYSRTESDRFYGIFRTKTILSIRFSITYSGRATKAVAGKKKAPVSGRTFRGKGDMRTPSTMPTYLRIRRDEINIHVSFAQVGKRQDVTENQILSGTRIRWITPTKNSLLRRFAFDGNQIKL